MAHQELTATPWRIRGGARSGRRPRHIIISGSDDATVRIWDAITTKLMIIRDMDANVQALATNPDLLVVAVSSQLCLFNHRTAQ